MKKLLLLGKKFDNDDTDAIKRRQRDLAVKIFLEAVNKVRKEKFILVDFCGRFQYPPEGSLEEAQ